jgi:hypothetical protein
LDPEDVEGGYNPFLYLDICGEAVTGAGVIILVAGKVNIVAIVFFIYIKRRFYPLYTKYNLHGYS